MKKTFILLATAALFAACSNTQNQSETNTIEVAMADIQTEKTMNFYDFKTTTLDGKPFDFESLKGKRVLIVNTASECGYTPQYKQLQELYATYGGEKFVIIGFPANNFGGQEPGSDAEIASFCEKNYGVTFPMMSKISVKGDDADPIYNWLTQKELNGVADAKVKWNFHKFLIDENGMWVKELSSSVSPLDEVVTSFAQGK
jgi:glutathione peroxidase